MTSNQDMFFCGRKDQRKTVLEHHWKDTDAAPFTTTIAAKPQGGSPCGHVTLQSQTNLYSVTHSALGHCPQQKLTSLRCGCEKSINMCQKF